MIYSFYTLLNLNFLADVSCYLKGVMHPRTDFFFEKETFSMYVTMRGDMKSEVMVCIGHGLMVPVFSCCRETKSKPFAERRAASSKYSYY